MPGTFSPPPRVNDPDMYHGTCMTHVPWCLAGSQLVTSGFLWSRWRGKRSRHFRFMRNPQIYVSGKRPIALPRRWQLASRSGWRSSQSPRSQGRPPGPHRQRGQTPPSWLQHIQKHGVTTCMMTSPNGNVSAITAFCAGNSLIKASDAELWCFFFICAWINGWINDGGADDLKCHHTHYDVIVMWWRHNKEMNPALLTFCECNASVTGGFPSQKVICETNDRGRHDMEMFSYYWNLVREIHRLPVDYNYSHEGPVMLTFDIFVPFFVWTNFLTSSRVIQWFETLYRSWDTIVMNILKAEQNGWRFVEQTAQWPVT